jgi:hypothetical protein
MREYKDLKMRTDSIELEVEQKQKFYDDLQKVLKGNIPTLDTNKLELPKAENMKE